MTRHFYVRYYMVTNKIYILGYLDALGNESVNSN